MGGKREKQREQTRAEISKGRRGKIGGRGRGRGDKCRGRNTDTRREGIKLLRNRTRVKPREEQERFHLFSTLRVI